MESPALTPSFLAQSRQPDLYASSTIPLIAAIVCVILRFWCRLKTGAGFWLDDWLIVAALISAIGLGADLLWWIPGALGRHVQAFGPNVMVHFAIGLFGAELTYTGVIVFVKLSILALYWRIFGANRSIRIPVIVLSAIVGAWGISVFFITVLQCIPTRGVWDKSIKASCNVDIQLALFVTSIPNITVDIILLALPVRYVAQLNISKQQKRVVASIFLLGGFVCIASILRLVSVLQESNNPDVTWNFVDQGIWAVVEADFAIISACLPTLRPVWLAIRPKRFAPATLDDSYSPSNPRTPRVKKPTSLWDISLPTSKYRDEDDTRPFSQLDNQGDIHLADIGHPMRRK